ncbi:MAG: hypothetical protein R3257_06345, partial [bacterium]|nr:hypothetical protein [bacterium]
WTWELLILLALALIFFFALEARLQNGLKYPEVLLNADPYRHHIRTVGVMETGFLSKFEPYQIGEVPIFELQGCYILAAVLGVAGPFTAHTLWLWGAQVFGAFGVLSLYLFTKLALRPLLKRDLGADKLHPDTAGTFLGLIAAAFLAASPVHILRTNAGFSEAYAIPLLVPTLLFYLWAAQSRIWGDFIWFGVFFSALALINPVPAVFILPFFMVHALVVLLKTKDLKWVWGNLLAAGVFFLCLAVWNWKFLAVPLITGAEATSHAGTEGMMRGIGTADTFWGKMTVGWEAFTKEIYRNLGFIHLKSGLSKLLFGLGGTLSVKLKNIYDTILLSMASAASIWIMWDSKKRRWSFDVTTSFFFLSFLVFIVFLFLIPFGIISFTSKYYRYLLPISLSLSVLCAYFLWRTNIRFFSSSSQRKVFLSLSLLVSLLIAADGKTWGGWRLNCTPEEYAAADWINQNTRPEDIIIANWYTGDYIRSLTKRRVIISEYPRPEVRQAMKKADLDIPILPRNPAKVIQYIQDHPGTYYLLKSKWGPWGSYDKYLQFEVMKTFGEEGRRQAKIFKVNVD